MDFRFFKRPQSFFFFFIAYARALPFDCHRFRLISVRRRCCDRAPHNFAVPSGPAVRRRSSFRRAQRALGSQWHWTWLTVPLYNGKTRLTGKRARYPYVRNVYTRAVGQPINRVTVIPSVGTRKFLIENGFPFCCSFFEQSVSLSRSLPTVTTTAVVTLPNTVWRVCGYFIENTTLVTQWIFLKKYFRITPARTTVQANDVDRIIFQDFELKAYLFSEIKVRSWNILVR